MEIALIVLAVLVLAVGYVIHLYNSLVRARQLAEEGWSGIDVQLKRRADLIPNLVNTLRGYVAHEKGTLEAVIAARNHALSVSGGDVAGRAAAEGALGQALGKLFALAESYPDLKASENFLGLQTSLETLEREIQMARRYYNGAVRELNILIETIPSSFVAARFSFTQKTYFEIADAAERALPEVSL
ncbi:MAG: LemA family protein [Alcaligenaceae bacterium]|nr:LemA family protein [Alcaligenaceae bacterium]